MAQLPAVCLAPTVNYNEEATLDDARVFLSVGYFAFKFM